MKRYAWAVVAAAVVWGLSDFLAVVYAFAHEGGFYDPFYRGQTDAGLALWHGQPHSNVSFYMPLQSVVHAFLASAPVWLVVAATGGLWLGCVALARALARELFGDSAGWAAAALAALLLPGMTPPYQFGWFETFLFEAAVLACAAASVHAVREPGWRSAALAGSAFAASLLIRSTLAFFPPLLALALLRRRSSLLLVALPALALAPWVYLNARVYHRFIPFENGRSDYNVIYAALGKVDNPQGENVQTAVRAAGLTAEEERHVLRWAADRILRDPLVFLEGCLRRLAYLLWVRPFFLAAAVFALWRERRRPGVAALALFAGYFLGIHCLVSTEVRYLQPLWPVLAAALAGLAFRGEPHGARSALAGAAAVYAPLSLATLWFVARYPSVIPHVP